IALAAALVLSALPTVAPAPAWSTESGRGEDPAPPATTEPFHAEEATEGPAPLEPAEHESTDEPADESAAQPTRAASEGSDAPAEPGESDFPEGPGSEPRGESELLGNPLLDGLAAPESALEPLAQSFAQQQGSSSAPLLTNAVTAAHVDAAGGRAYAATRSSVPAQLLVHDLGTGSSQAHDLPVGNGAWDLSQSGSTL